MGPLKDGWTEEDVAAIIARDIPDELLYVPIVISLDSPDCAWSEAVCISLTHHPHFNVRGNAILGLGHLARLCGQLDWVTVLPAISRALSDDHEYVRMHANDVAGDLLHGDGIHVPGYVSTHIT